MMLDKLSTHSNENEDNLSGRDKAMKAQEKKKLEAMIERHNGLVGPTMEAQSKVDHYSECYAFGDDIHPVMKVLNEQRHLSCKEIHPHNMDMCEDQIEKQEKVLRTIENQAPIYNELMRRGLKLKANPNAPSFLEREIKKLEETWKDTNEKAQERIALLNCTFKDWEVYEQQRQAIYTPIEALEEQFKTYKKIYDPKKGTDWLERKKKKAAEYKKAGLEVYDVITKCFKTIVGLAGEDKREFMEKDILEIDERKTIIEKVDKTLEELTEFNKKLHKFVDTLAELRAWMMPACEKLNFITTSTELSPEDRVKEIFDLQGQVNERLPLLEPLEAECHLLFDVPAVDGEESEEGQTNETALNHMKEFFTIKETINELHEKVEMEAGSISQDQKYFAEYLYGVKNFKPWMDDAENVAKTSLNKPAKIEDAIALLETVKKFEAACAENKQKLDAAADSRSHMEKQTKADNEVETLTSRWDTVKKVADERVAKIQELCDTWSELQKITNNLTEIIATVPSLDTPDVSSLEGIFKQFKEINDKKSLCRDLEKEGMKEWLDLMLEKIAMRVSSDECTISTKDKEFKNAEKKKLQALIDRHDKLLPPTQETQKKVDVYARCYAYGDDITPCLKTLEEMHHLSVKEIHPHNLGMLEEQIEKAEKVIATVDSQRDTYEELMKRGKKLLQNPNKAPFLTDVIEKLEKTWIEANKQSKIRHSMLTNTAKDWEKYDELRSSINEPLEKLENELKRYRKFFDPAMGLKKLIQKKAVFAEQKKIADNMFAGIQNCYKTIIVLAGEDKKDFLDKEVNEVEEKRVVIGNCMETLTKLEEYNEALTKAVNHARELEAWAGPTNQKLKQIITDDNLSPEERVKEILILQDQSRERLPQVEPLDEDYNKLLTEEDMEKSETARNSKQTWQDIKTLVEEVCAEVEKEAGSISTDQKFYADYLCGVKNFKPWMEATEAKVKEPLPKPDSLHSALTLLESCKAFDAECINEKEKLDAAGKARESMEKASNTENEVMSLSGRWDAVKKVAVERVEKAQALVATWDDLKKTTEQLTEKMVDIPKKEDPNLEELEKTFNAVKELFTKKKQLLAAV